MSIQDLVHCEQSETPRLEARGRIPREETHLGDVPLPRQRKRNPQEIDGVRLSAYDEQSESFTIRANDGENPAFWCEIDVQLPLLQKWLQQQGVEMSYCLARKERMEDCDDL